MKFMKYHNMKNCQMNRRVARRSVVAPIIFRDARCTPVIIPGDNRASNEKIAPRR
jgi:hypothetical protein